jgi:cytidine deaminase
MKKIKRDAQDLKIEDRILIQTAEKARDNAYAPYSKCKVGAAVMAENTKIYSGCNIETVTLSQTIHAEKAAITAMVADGQRKILALCCVSKNGGIPCAECRQMIWEFCDENPNVKIICVDLKGNVILTTIGELYPQPFGPKDLK